MPRRRFFIPADRIRDGSAVLTPDQAHHLRNVLRLEAGAEVELFDGEGLSFSGKIEYQGTNIRIGALKKLEEREAPKGEFVLAPALIRSERFEWMLEKATELGATRFIPLQTRFTTIRIPDARLTARLARWERIVTEASKQCRRLTVPKIHAPRPWDDFLAAQESVSCARLMLYEKASARLRAVPGTTESILLCIGPEGGWEHTEAQAADQAGFQLVSMGSRILRAETAAIAAVAILQSSLDWSGNLRI